MFWLVLYLVLLYLIDSSEGISPVFWLWIVIGILAVVLSFISLFVPKNHHTAGMTEQERKREEIRRLQREGEEAHAAALSNW